MLSLLNYLPSAIFEKPLHEFLWVLSGLIVRAVEASSDNGGFSDEKVL